MSMQLEIVTPAGAKAQAKVRQVTAPGTVGELGLLPGHRPLITSLGIGKLSYTPEGGEVAFLAVNGGYLEVANDHVIVITETAETPAEIDEDRARAALDRADKQLRDLAPDRKEARTFAEQARKRAQNRLEVAKLRKTAPPPV